MEGDYLKVIFAYSYGCYAFKHNICGDQPEVPNGMPDYFGPLLLEFFMILRCLLVPTTIEETAVKAHLSEVAKEPKRTLPPGTRADSNPSFVLSFFFFFKFL